MRTHCYTPLIYFQSEAKSPRDGYVSAIDSMEIGLTGVLLGAGRKTVEESVDFSAGIVFRKKPGAFARRGDVLAEVHTERGGVLESAVRRVLEAFSFSDEEATPLPLITNLVTKDAVVDFDSTILTDE